jgi:DNA end-binding protein Ku
MAAHAQWKGHLRIMAVTIPVRLYAATEKKEKISFHRYHAECGSRVQMKNWCPIHAKELLAPDIERGYEHEPGKHLVVTDEELDTVAAQSSGAIEITTVTTDPLNPVYVDGTLYLVPEPGAQVAFETVRRALKDRLAIGSVVLRNRAVRVALEAAPQGFIVYKLRAAEQVRAFSQVEQVSLNVMPSNSDLALATQLLDNLEGPFSYGDVRDQYNDALKELLAAKQDGTALPVKPVVSQAALGLTDALAQSLQLQQAKKAAALPTSAKANLAKATLPPKAVKGKKTA